MKPLIFMERSGSVEPDDQFDRLNDYPKLPFFW